MAWGIFGGNRYLIMEPEKGNRILIDHVEYRFRIFPHHSRISDTSLNRYIVI